MQQLISITPKVTNGSQEWPDHHSFKIGLSSIGAGIYLLAGDQKNIDAFCSVYDDMVTKLTSLQATDIGKAASPERDEPCNTCGQARHIAEFVLPDLNALEDAIKPKKAEVVG